MNKPGLCYPFSTRTCDRPQCPCRAEKQAAAIRTRPTPKKGRAKK